MPGSAVAAPSARRPLAASVGPPKSKVEQVRLRDILPCPENDDIYAAPSMDDPDIIELIKSIKANGLLEPIRISVDNVIISGHRRRILRASGGASNGPSDPRQNLLRG